MKNGFTLVELLAILVLLGIIVIVAVPSVIESNKVSKENQIKEYTEAVKTACESYAAVNGSASGKTIQDLKDAGYLKKGLTKPNGATITGCS